MSQFPNRRRVGRFANAVPGSPGDGSNTALPLWLIKRVSDEPWQLWGRISLAKILEQTFLLGIG